MDLPWRLFAGILILWLLVGLLPTALWGDLHDASDFANTFGFVNALFAALAFGGVIWAIRLQTRELELQRLEIEETRDELRRSADAQHKSQEMHFFTALLMARNSVAGGYANCAENETGPLQLNRLAHRRHLAQLEWLLELIDRQEGNPFALPSDEVLIAQQIASLLSRAHPLLESALKNRATNYARALALDRNQSIRELRRLLTEPGNLATNIDSALSAAEAVTTASEYDDVAEICRSAFNPLSDTLSKLLGRKLPTLTIPITGSPIDGRPTQQPMSSN